jgi:hypothetical protein
MSKLLNCYGVIRTYPSDMTTSLGFHVPLTNARAAIALRNYQPTPRVGEDIQRRRARHQPLSLNSDADSEFFNLFDDEVLDAFEGLDSLT